MIELIEFIIGDAGVLFRMDNIIAFFCFCLVLEFISDLIDIMVRGAKK